MSIYPSFTPKVLEQKEVADLVGLKMVEIGLSWSDLWQMCGRDVGDHTRRSMELERKTICTALSPVIFSQANYILTHNGYVCILLM
jgi:hypothetical protein